MDVFDQINNVPSINESPRAPSLDGVRDERDESIAVSPDLEISLTLKIGSERKVGTFIYKVPSPKDWREIARREAVQRAGIPSEAFVIDMGYAIRRDAYLSVTIREAPEWWKEADAAPGHALQQRLYEVVLKHEAAFLGSCEAVIQGEAAS